MSPTGILRVNSYFSYYIIFIFLLVIFLFSLFILSMFIFIVVNLIILPSYIYKDTDFTP